MLSACEHTLFITHLSSPFPLRFLLCGQYKPFTQLPTDALLTPPTLEHVKKPFANWQKQKNKAKQKEQRDSSLVDCKFRLGKRPNNGPHSLLDVPHGSFVQLSVPHDPYFIRAHVHGTGACRRQFPPACGSVVSWIFRQTRSQVWTGRLYGGDRYERVARFLDLWLPRLD